MKALLTALFTIALVFAGYGQMPITMNYQGVARDASGSPLVNQPITVRFTIHQATPTGTVVYDEDQYNVITTDDKGHFTTTIGDGFLLNGSSAITSIDWSTGPYFLEVGLDPTGALNYSSVGTQQLVAVPYALHAKTAETVLNGGGGEWTANGNDISNSNTGDVGIGTTTPAGKLDVRGTVNFEQADRSFYIPSWAPVNQRVFAGVFNGRGVNSPVIRYQGLNSNFIDEGIDNDGDYILNTNGTTRFTVQQNGNIGIGTISPTTKLNIQGGSDASLSAGSGYLQTGAETSTNMVMDNNEIQVRNNGNTATMYVQAEGGEFRVGDVTTARMVVRSDNDRVGIGTASPNALLAVKATNFGYEDGINLSNSSDDWYMYQDANKGLRFRDDGTERLVISSSGTMSLKGKFTCEEVEVSLSAFPDYVFEEDYNLLSLQEIEAYIEEHGHLPNVPSAEKIEEEGLGLGELNKILMEKVEELTLHLIEKDKTLDQLAERLQALENEASKNAN